MGRGYRPTHEASHQLKGIRELEEGKELTWTLWKTGSSPQIRSERC